MYSEEMDYRLDSDRLRAIRSGDDGLKAPDFSAGWQGSAFEGCPNVSSIETATPAPAKLPEGTPCPPR